MMNQKGFTLIELIMTVVILGIISVVGAYLLMFVVQNSVFMPKKINADMIALDALRLMIEGDAPAKGLRFSRAINTAQDNQVDFNFFDNADSLVKAKRFRLDTGTGKLYQSVAGGTETLVPYYLGSGLTLTGQSNKLFSYYDANESPTAVLADIRRIQINLVVKSGSGSYSDWEGQSQQSSAIAVRVL